MADITNIWCHLSTKNRECLSYLYYDLKRCWEVCGTRRRYKNKGTDMIKIDDLRTAHIEGQTFAAYGNNYKSYITAGAEGDVRSYPDLFDDETVSISAGSRVTCMVSKGKKVVLANDLHEVKSYSLPDLILDSVLLRFTASVNHICISEDGSKVGAASSDFSIKIVNSDGSEQKTFTGHSAPVFSLCIGNNDNMISCSCDGSLRIWDLGTQKCSKVLDILPKYNSSSNQMCVISMSPVKNEHVVVPFEKTFKVFSTVDWSEDFTLPAEHSENVCIVQYSPCGKYVCSATTNGELFTWDISARKCIKKYQQHLNKCITSLQWNGSDGKTVLFADIDGEIGICTLPISKDQTDEFGDDYDILGDMLLNDNMMEGDAKEGDDQNDGIYFSASAKKGKKRVLDDDDDDVDDVPVTATKKHRLNNADSFLNDEAEDDDDADVDDTNISLNLIKEGLLGDLKKPVIDEDNDSLSSFVVEKVWNAVGIIRCHSEDDISSIDVEFHDTKTSHPLHIPNAMNNTMAVLSNTVVLFACEKQDNMPSKLMCTHFASWDSNKEWSIPMPDGENIECICANSDHIFIATSARLLRILSVGGIQTQLISIPGPIVCMAIHEQQFIAVYQKAAGLKGCQSFGVLHMRFNKNSWKIFADESISLKPRVCLTWLGFSTEGTPAMVDSSGDVLLLQRSSNSWIPIANTKKQAKNKSDNYWVVGIEERSAQIRCIYCKGANFPATLPRPVPTVIPFQIPLCDIKTEKSMKEHELIKSQLISSNVAFNRRLVQADIDDDVSDLEKQQTQLLMQLFALSCKSDREYRAIELCKLMSLEAVGLAIQYASKMRKLGIAKRLTELAQTKAAEEEGDEDEEEDEEEEEEGGALQKQGGDESDQFELSDDDDFMESVDFDKENVENTNHRSTTASLSIRKKNSDGGRKDDGEELLKNLKKNRTSESQISNSASSQSGSNPFKVGAQKGNNSIRGTNYFETLESQKLQKNKTGNKAVEKKQIKKKTVTLPLVNKKSNKIVVKQKNLGEENTAPVPKKLTGFQLFMKEHTESKTDEEKGENFVQDIMVQWKKLSAEEKKAWSEQANGSRDALKNSNHNLATKTDLKISSKNKLSSFAFKKNES
ncbi:WD repeat and HMG-box DNA-binding protein 1-like isoform X2 [Hydractinia symbiolongicarpus]|uniref:WD repeat and HMG-box DNA-binding protein 1-like isoform X2 n=1 Tax=Hydractinia symbiolongicarpus TaxID=13093 RepID=UPI002551261E|nr:WD repeat and HMG-box DNA-binding protein 1-like isoform X2 [Hydractinia symbiolongicarpus]